MCDVATELLSYKCNKYLLFVSCVLQLLDITEQPIGGGSREAKRRKKQAGEYLFQQRFLGNCQGNFAGMIYHMLAHIFQSNIEAQSCDTVGINKQETGKYCEGHLASTGRGQSKKRSPTSSMGNQY